MNLDDLNYFNTTDPENFLRHIDALPDQLETAFKAGQTLPLPDSYRDIQHVVILGMGGSAISADLLCALAAPHSPASLAVLRGYDLPAHAAGPRTLVIGSSYSGNTEETLAAFEQAAAPSRRTKLLALTTGGRLAEMAGRSGSPVWDIRYSSPPRAALGYSFGLLLALAARLGLLPDPAANLAATVSTLRAQMQVIGAQSPVAKNPAKRMAGQMMERIPVLFGADLLAPVARRWKGQINEIAKSPAHFEELPEADHNAVVGSMFPESLLSKYILLFLRAPSNHPRNLRRLEATRHIFMTHGFNTDTIDATGHSRLAHLLTALHFGDYTAYYLAMAYGADPTPVPQIDELKAKLADPE